LRQFLSSFEPLKAQQLKPMRMHLTSEQLLRTFANSFWLQRSDKAAVIQKESQKAEIVVTEATLQKEVIA
jgi:hypothetical protein